MVNHTAQSYYRFISLARGTRTRRRGHLTICGLSRCGEHAAIWRCKTTPMGLSRWRGTRFGWAGNPFVVYLAGAGTPHAILTGVNIGLSRWRGGTRLCGSSIDVAGLSAGRGEHCNVFVE
ncbi:hypothetical protein J4732_08975 [Serratia marcescens]|uniref:Uncharacterized protein n=1 Tax=Serratia marcescens TaxID=615 RepID=A0A939NJT4_SERMA|nr:hypothetical protein [Serratia marcescens]